MTKFALKRQIGIIAAGLMAINASAIDKEPYRLDVELTGFPDSTQFVLTDFKNLSDTAMLIRGKASFEIDIPKVSGEDCPIDLRLAGPVPLSPGYCSMYMLGQNGYHERVTGDRSQFRGYKLKIEGAPWSDELMTWGSIVGDKEIEERALRDSMNITTGKEQRRIYEKMSRLKSEIDSLNIAFIENNPNSFVALKIFSFWYKTALSHERLTALYNSLEPKYRDSKHGRLMAKLVNKKCIEVGDKLADYDIAGTIADGSYFKLSDVKNDYIALFFTSAGCGPCIEMKKEIETLDCSDRIAIVGYVIDDDPMFYKTAVNQGGGKIPLIQTDGERWNSDAELKYGVAAIPSLYIFGPDRTLLEKTRGWRSGKVKQIFEKYIDAKVSD
ncbi:hypothetical protein [uncultured Muribaculum sp.]|uniref:TlpA family protein disulfide reductase n=1 Tax=uncultured Muribaculum sp. TaxID=1918613 RepID=UPI0025942682|nr:hypothetical protein [uncultured Muribaculum sp.]